MLSIVIPTLNCAATLEAVIAAVTQTELGAAFRVEVMVADGGSTDGTSELARQAGARLIDVPRGRGGQLAAGAAETTGEWLLFLHGDTVLAAGWAGAASRFMEASENTERAAYFRFALDDPSPAARRLETMVGWRNRVLGLPFGDQGLLMTRPFYLSLGGYPTLPIMEDVAMARRIGRARLVALEGDAVTSADRYRAQGYLVRPLRNIACQVLYFAGVPPRLIRKLYE